MLEHLQKKLIDMKELILIGAYCPDYEREKLLNDCVDSLQGCRNEYDILIASHSEIPKYISQKVDYTFYDRNNDLITDLKYLNQPWFSPVEGMTILSTYISKYSTYLAVYRLLIFGLGFAKMFGYEKVHYIEYDTVMNDLSELYDNSKLLNDYDNIVIQKKERNYEMNLAWPIGNFLSFKVDKIDEVFTTYNREKLLDILFKSDAKTNEKITNDIMKLNGNKIYVKDFDNIKFKDIKFALSDKTSKENDSFWAVPFYNTKEDKIYVVAWNDRSESPIDVNFIINDNQIISFKKIKKYEWNLGLVGDIQEVESILVIVNNRVKTHIIFNDNNRDLFKKTNYSHHTT
jgi:hypothetical protein